MFANPLGISGMAWFVLSFLTNIAVHWMGS